MSLRIECPNCGRRPIEEFVYEELSAVPDWIVDPDERNVDLAFMRSNPEGSTTERWFHSFGCRRWLTISRDTTTDRIVNYTKEKHG
jgi:heterotetrameric sarcosine oxidase delta subunit